MKLFGIKVFLLFTQFFNIESQWLIFERRSSPATPSFSFPLKNPPFGQRCKGRNYGDKRCCTPINPCGLGEGDCDGPGDGGQHDGHRGCLPGLVCGSNNCKKFGLYYHEKDDCCDKPTISDNRDAASSQEVDSLIMQGVPIEPPLGQRCKGRNYGERRCCSPENPCDEGEGDCDGPGDGVPNDGNRGCKPGLVCGSNNCRKFGLYYHEKDDCCEKQEIVQFKPAPLIVNKNNSFVKLGPRCQGRNIDKGKCCTMENPCDEGEGDCENDFECNGNLVCGVNNCKQFSDVFHPKDDCCVKLDPTMLEIACSSCSNPSSPLISQAKTRCQGRNVDQGKCCTRENPCEEGQGDCEDNEECSGDLMCGTNNCKQFSDIFHPKDDCCVKPTPSFIIPNPVSSSGIKSPRCQGRNVGQGRGSCCNAETPCEFGEGDCETDRDCIPGLVCGNNNCKQFGEIFHPKDDCCVKPSFSSSSSSSSSSATGSSQPSSTGIPAEPSPNQRCAGRNFGDRRCCTPENPCEEGEGDCDGPGDGGQHDGHRGCKPGLVCGSNNCRKFGLYYHEKDDCCEKPSTAESVNPTQKPPKGLWLEPPEGEKCSGRNYQGRRCCTPENPCDIGEGDCDGPGDGGQHDGNSGCKAGLVCGSNNCLKYGAYFHPKDDCCEKPDGSGGWQEWRPFSTCSKSCGGGKWQRNRYCKGPGCPHTTQSQERFCNFNSCPFL